MTSPRTTVPATFAQQHSSADVREVMAGMVSALQQNQMIFQNMLTTFQQVLLAQGFSHTLENGLPHQGLVSPPPAANNIGSPLCGHQHQGQVSPSQAVNNIGSHLCCNQHQGLVSPASVDQKAVLREDDLLKESSALESPNNVVGSPHSLQSSAAVPESPLGTKKKKGQRSSTGKRKRVNFDTMLHKDFPNSEGALVWLEKPHHPTFLLKYSHTNKKHHVFTYKCRAECDDCCRAQMKVPLDDDSKEKKTELRIHVQENCMCMDQRQTSNGSKLAKRVVPAEIRTITRQVCQDNPHDKPETIFRKVFKVIEQTPHLRHYVPPKEHEKLRKQVKNLIPSIKNELLGADFLFLRMDKVADLERLRDLYPFKLPSEQLDLPDDVKEASDLLFARKPKCIIVNTSDLDPDDDPELVRHKLLTVLDGERDTYDGDPLSEAEVRLHNRIDHLAKKNDVENPWSKVVCYTSLALLWNLKDCAKLDFKVMGAADGTHGTTAFGERLLVFGCFDVKCETNVRTFRPFIHAVCPMENELYFSMMVVTLLKYARRMFGLRDFNFKGMLVSDRAEAFVNTWKNAFPDSKPAQCFTHILRKFQTNDKSKGGGNGSYRSDYDRDKGTEASLPKFVVDDVHSLSQCLTEQQFLSLWEMIKIEWEKEGGLAKITNKFYRSYIKDDNFNKWFVGASGIACCYPDNNPTENYNLDLKGTSQRDGACEVKKKLPEMVQRQFPKAVHLASNSAMVRRDLPIERDGGLVDSKSKRYDSLMAYASYVRPELDIRETAEDCFYMNTCLSLDERPLEQLKGLRNKYSSVKRSAEKIKEPHEYDSDKQCKEWDGWLTVDVKDHRYVSTERVKLYEDCLQGKKCFKPENRRMFLRSVWSLCKVTRRPGNGVTGYSGSCPYFLKNGWCVHAAFMKNSMRKKKLYQKLYQNLTTKVLMNKHLQTLSRHVRRSLFYVDRAFQNVHMLPAHDRWENLKTSVGAMKNALDHICKNVLPTESGSERVAFPSQKLGIVMPMADKSVVLYTLSIELALDSSRLCQVRWTRKNSGDANPQQMSTIESNLKDCVTEIRNLFERLGRAADTDGQTVVEGFPYERLTGQV